MTGIMKEQKNSQKVEIENWLSNSKNFENIYKYIIKIF